MNPNNIDELESLEKIKKAKELLDLGAISQNEFEEIKEKYLKKINSNVGTTCKNSESDSIGLSSILETVLEDEEFNKKSFSNDIDKETAHEITKSVECWQKLLSFNNCSLFN
ncbi:MAG: SHOCT domain-containing protein [Methanobrevibacter sp.]|uniref:SHOCT domain-containing protein n=1 Tax=Methanobrevibacter sp. TaxID=66852 RepID=UPI002E77658E|nr:SHOCT domain-containing protein [Methanobrevibacter sp.]MEE0942475.1 SHOCT domain-containing protein [Methanobrevibacter sp.]